MPTIRILDSGPNLFRASTRKQVKSWEGKNIGVSFGLRDRSSGDGSRKRGNKGKMVAMARVLRVICNSQVGRAEERCEIRGRFSGEEQARRTKRTRRCLSGLFANDVPMSRVTLTRRHLEPAAMNFSIPTFPSPAPFRPAEPDPPQSVTLLIVDAYLHRPFCSSIVEIAYERKREREKFNNNLKTIPDNT